MCLAVFTKGVVLAIYKIAKFHKVKFNQLFKEQLIKIPKVNLLAYLNFLTNFDDTKQAEPSAGASKCNNFFNTY